MPTPRTPATHEAFSYRDLPRLLNHLSMPSFMLASYFLICYLLGNKLSLVIFTL